MSASASTSVVMLVSMLENGCGADAWCELSRCSSVNAKQTLMLGVVRT